MSSPGSPNDERGWSATVARGRAIFSSVPRGWSLVGQIAVILVVIPACWLILARLTGVTSGGQDPLGLVLILAGIMGAIFTVGGLVIALASIVTLLSINERVRSTIQRELPDFKEQADRQIQAYLLLQTSATEDVERAAALVEQALHLYPAAHHARSDLGLRLTEVVMADFIRRHGDPDMVYAAWPAPWEPPPPFSEAVRWLRAAWDHGDARDGRVLVALLTVYGAQRYYDSVIALVRTVRDTYPDQLAYLREQERLAILSYACVPFDERLRELGGALGVTLPMNIEDVRKAIAAIDLSDDNTGPHYADFYVVGRFSKWSDDLSRFPVLMRILLTATEAGIREGRLILPWPTLTERRELYSNGGSFRPVDDIIADLEPLVHFICSVKSGRHSPSILSTNVINLP